MIGQLFAGVGLGLLVGLLLGLSSSPVVSLVVGALATGMLALLGFARKGETAETIQTEGSPIRLGSFGFACVAAVLIGLCIRTYNWASPSIEEQIKKIQRAGYSPEEARRWVAFRNLGITLTSGQEQPHSDTKATPVASSVLFSGGNSGQCQYFDSTRYKDSKEQLNALHDMGGTYAEYAGKINALEPNQQKTVLEGLRLLFCPQ